MKKLKQSIMVMVWAAALLGLVGCTVNPATGRKQLALISTQQEIDMGKNSAPEFEAQFDGKLPDAVLQAYVQEVGAKIAAAADREMPYEFALLAGDVPNAFAIPGGKVYVTAGLMRYMTNERQLAAVLGHEVGHVCALHIISGIQRDMGFQILIEAAGYVGGSSAYSSAAKVALGLVDLKFSRSQEYQADQLGIRYMTRANYNPYGMVELLDILLAMHDKEPSKLAAMFQTHPLTSQRIEEAQAIITNEHPQANPAEPDPNADRMKQMVLRLPPPSKTNN
ncbi:MAG: M48 family metalloprotease [Sedimentisphaerales bacterium]|nr:M48 family metalloprotease [Sedimentisphaerales bacterium]